MDVDDIGSVSGGIPPTLDLGIAQSSTDNPHMLPLPSIGDGAAEILADTFGGTSIGSWGLSTTEIVGARPLPGQEDFLSRREALSVAQTLGQQSAVANAELEEMRRQLHQIRSETSQGPEMQSRTTQAATSNVHSRVDETVARFEAIGQQTTTTAAQAQTSSATALERASQAASIGAQAQDTASQAHSAGTEAIHRTEVLLKKQNEEVEDLRQQLTELKNAQQASNDLAKNMHEVIKQTQAQLTRSQDGMVLLHTQVQDEQGKVASVQKQLLKEKERTALLTEALQQGAD